MSQIPDWALSRREVWKYRGDTRPPFAFPTRPGQESVWDYPRPPRVEADDRRIVVRVGDWLLAETVHAYRILETSGPPTVYVPPADVRTEALTQEEGESRCEWKGIAAYFSVMTPTGTIRRSVWSYLDPFLGFEAIRGFYSFYPSAFECFVDEERVRPQPGQVYGGWVTDEIIGPFKGEPGSESW